MKKNKIFLFPCSLLLALSISSCGAASSSSVNSSSNEESSSLNNESSVTSSSSQVSSSATSSSSKTQGTSYNPNPQDETIYFATESTLSKATYDSSKDEYTFTVSNNYKQVYVNLPSKTRKDITMDG